MMDKLFGGWRDKSPEGKSPRGEQTPAKGADGEKQQKQDKDDDDSDDDDAGGYEPHSFLEEERLLKTRTRDYFVILGLPSASPRGNALLHRYQLWQLLTALLTLADRADLPLLLMNTINCHSSSEQSMARGMMALCCNSPHPAVRLAAARHLGVLATARVPKFDEWGMALLRGMLEDGDPLVREAAHVEVLEACENAECFVKLISMMISPEQLLSEHASAAKGRRGLVRPLDGSAKDAKGAEPPAAEGLAPNGSGPGLPPQ